MSDRVLCDFLDLVDHSFNWGKNKFVGIFVEVDCSKSQYDADKDGFSDVQAGFKTGVLA
jgi:hypothetical protein